MWDLRETSLLVTKYLRRNSRGAFQPCPNLRAGRIWDAATRAIRAATIDARDSDDWFSMPADCEG